MQDVGNMLKMKFWFEGNQLQPDCNIHGGCKIGSSACHACPHCVRVNSKDQEVLCLGDGSGCSLVVGWSLYEPDEAIELTPSQAMDFHECLEELSEVDIRFNVNGHSIENGSIRLSYNIYEHSIMVTRVWLNGKESKELLSTIQQWLDNNQE